MANILFIASWYPGRVNEFDGDFVERHAKCISLYNKVFVAYVVKDENIKDGKTVVEKEISGNLITYKAYYPYSNSRIGWIEKIHSNRLYFRLHLQIFKSIVKEYGRPDITHLNMLMKGGVIAWWLKKRYKLPYVLSENWTGYYPERKPGYRDKSFFYQFLSRLVYKNCDYALPVSRDLGERMNQLLGKIPYKVIPNVVDTCLFYPDFENKNTKTRLVHASTLGYHKNIWGILHVTEKLFQQRKDFEFHLIGPASSDIIEWTKDHGLLNNCIFFKGLIPYDKVAGEVRNSDALIMFSRYENLPCIILEALTCGIPVLSTDVGGIKEIITMQNGILIRSEHEDELLNGMNQILDSINKYDKRKISLSAKNTFSYEVAGRQFDEVYKKVLSTISS
jgi:glycosyltransferase involved in cell wall biosynthesis